MMVIITEVAADIEAMEEEDVPRTAEAEKRMAMVGIGGVEEEVDEAIVVEEAEVHPRGCVVVILASTMRGSKGIKRLSREPWPTSRHSSYSS
jgi:hypothetical protein